MEQEYKYRLCKPIPAGAVAPLDVQPFHLAGPTLHRLQDTLLDTADHQLGAKHWAFRIRHDNDATLLTLKRPGEGGAGNLHVRDELEMPWDEDLQRRNAYPPEIQAVLGDITPDDLAPILQIENTRFTWSVVDDDDREIAELALDDGYFIVGEARQHFRELELELKQGSLSDLVMLDQRIHRALPVDPEPRSKLARGLALRKLNESPGGIPLATLVSEVLSQNLDKLREAELVARKGDDPEGVHDLRVASRRLRTALQVLGEAGIHRKRAKNLRKGLKTLANASGEVRDADVQLEELAGRDDELGPLIARISDRREVGREDMLHAIDAGKTRKLLAKMDKLTADLAAEGENPMPDDPTPRLARHFSGSALWSRYQVVLAYETVLPDADDQTLHKLRISIKRLRYAVEFFLDTLSAEAGSVRKQLVSMQDCLGEHHDATVLIGFVDTLRGPDDGSAALTAFRQEQEQRRQDLRAKAMSDWPALAAPEFRATLGRLLAPTG